MKNSLKIAAIFALLLCTLVFSVSALPTDVEVNLEDLFDVVDDTSPSICVEDVTGYTGKTVDVNIGFANNPGFAGLTYSIEYDEDVMSLESYSLGLGASMCVTSPEGTNPMKFVYAGMRNATGDGILARLTFEIFEDAPEGEYPITIYYEEGSCFRLQGYEEIDYTPDIYEGSVEIREYAEYDITYDANGGSGAPSDDIKVIDEDYYISDVIPEREGYNFLGWSTYPGGYAEFESGDLYDANDDIDLYAVWEIKVYEIVYITNEGWGELAQEKIYGEAFEIYLDEIWKEGYIFQGWATEPDGEVVYENGDIYYGNEDLTLYGIWMPETVTVSYDANGGSYAPEDEEFSILDGITVTYDEPSKTGYRFAGWAFDPDADEVDVRRGDSFESSEDVTLYAVWRKNIADEDEFRIYVQDRIALPGEEITVYISIDNNIGFAGMEYDVIYDTSVLEVVSYEKQIGSAVCVGSAIDTFYDRLRFVYAGTGNITENGVLVAITFKVSEDAVPGDVAEIEIVPANGSFFNYEGTQEVDIDIGVNDGTVSVVDHIPGDIDNDGAVSNRDALRILQYLAGWDVYVMETALDANGDGYVNARDAARVLQYLAGWNVELH